MGTFLALSWIEQDELLNLAQLFEELFRGKIAQAALAWRCTAPNTEFPVFVNSSSLWYCRNPREWIEASRGTSVDDFVAATIADASPIIRIWVAK